MLDIEKWQFPSCDGKDFSIVMVDIIPGTKTKEQMDNDR